jgi:hypothetical protein
MGGELLLSFLLFSKLSIPSQLALCPGTRRGKAFSLHEQDRDVIFASGIVGGGNKLLHDGPGITRVFLSNSQNLCGSE